MTPVLAGGLFTIQPTVKTSTKLNYLCLSLNLKAPSLLFDHLLIIMK